MAKVIRNNFTSGEVSPKLRMRDDLALYGSGLRTCRNVIVQPEGGVKSRAGAQVTSVLGTTDLSSARAIPFVFSEEMAFQVVLSTVAIQILWMGNPVATMTSATTGWPGYTAEEIQRLQYLQTLDVMVLTVEGKPPTALRRHSNASWSLTSALWEDKYVWPVQPVSTGLGMTAVTYNPFSRTLTATGTSPGVGVRFWVQNPALGSPSRKGWDFMVTSVGSTFTATLVSGDVPSAGAVPSTLGGEVCLATAVGEVASAGTYTKDYYYRVTAVMADGTETPAGAVVSAVGIKTLTSVYGLKFSWMPVGGAQYYRIYKESAPASGVFGWIGDSASNTYTDFNTAPLTSDTISAGSPLPIPTPAAAAMYQQRLILGGGGQFPAQVLASKTGNYFSTQSSSPIRDTDAFSFNLSSPSYETVRSMVSMDRLYMFTSDGAWALGEGVNEVLTPFSFSAKKISYEGVSYLPPIVMGSTFIIVPARRDRVLAASAGASGALETSDLTSTSRHLFDGKTVKQVIRQRKKGDFIWVLFTDGSMAVLTLLREHKITAWVPYVSSAFSVISLVATPEYGQDAVYAVAKVGASYTFLRLTEPPLANEVPAMDLWKAAAGTSEVHGLGLLEGRQVTALVDGTPHAGLYVTNGVVVLPERGDEVYVGVPFESVLETFKMYPETDDIGREGQMLKVRAHLDGESPVKVEVGDDTGYYQSRDVANGYDAPLPGEVMDVDIPPGWRDGFSIKCTADLGVPLSLLALEIQVEV